MSRRDPHTSDPFLANNLKKYVSSVDYLENLDALRGVAALLVAVYHFERWAVPELDLGPFSAVIENGYIWVDFFFVLSGFVITHVYRSVFMGGIVAAKYRNFLGARFARIYPLHVATLMMLVGLEAAKLLVVVLGASVENMPFTDRQSFWALTTNLLLIHSWNVHDDVTWNIPSWSISTEWAVYLFCPFLIVLLGRIGRLVGLAVALCCVAGLHVMSLDRPLELDITYDLGVLRCFLGFLIGIILHGIYRDGLPGFLRGDAALVLALGTGLVPMAFDLPDALAVPGLAATILAAAGNQGHAAAILSSRPLVAFGRLSYGIYLSHIVIMATAMDAWKLVFRSKLGVGYTQGESLVVLCILIAATVLFSAVLYRMVELPGRRLLRSWLCHRYKDVELPTSHTFPHCPYATRHEEN